MKRNLFIAAAVVGLALSGCKPSRIESEVVASPQPVAVVPRSEAPRAVTQQDLLNDLDPTTDMGAGELFSFPEDIGGKLLAKLLSPNVPARQASLEKASPKPRAGIAVLERPDVPQATVPPRIPTIPQRLCKATGPRLVSDVTPLAYMNDNPVVPHQPAMPPAALIRQPAHDVNEPAALPLQAKQIVDRAPLDDPTAEFSTQAVVAYQPAMRSQPQPFVKINLPEPFEHRVSIKPPTTEPPVVAPVPALPK